ncbi:uncharacterized protein V1518DRAFT_413348 [Limtongia smithiae]|uniref:uncharacterized protein n=1 Tax=Limtongia smithiae TaxID=1125753 RepID=UPI0034CD0F2F
MPGGTTVSVQKHSHATVPFSAQPANHLIPWVHSPYRDSLVLVFCDPPSPLPAGRIRVLWRTHVLEDVDLAAAAAFSGENQPALSVIARTPCIGVKFTCRARDGSLLIRRFQLRFESDDTFGSALAEFERRNATIRGAALTSNMSILDSQFSASSLPYLSQPEVPITQSSTQPNLPSTQPSQQLNSPVAQTIKLPSPLHLPASPLSSSIAMHNASLMSDNELSSLIAQCLTDKSSMEIVRRVERILNGSGEDLLEKSISLI